MSSRRVGAGKDGERSPDFFPVLELVRSLRVTGKSDKEFGIFSAPSPMNNRHNLRQLLIKLEPVVHRSPPDSTRRADAARWVLAEDSSPAGTSEDRETRSSEALAVCSANRSQLVGTS